MRTLTFVMLVAASTACAQSSAPGDGNPRTQRILFVGNSLTYTNDLPGMVAAIARQAGDTFTVASAAGPNLALIDHLNGATDAAARIAGGGWDWVILQQGPTTVEMCRDSLILWTRMFDTLARAAGARPALLMTWPTAAEPGLFDAVRVSFQEAARAVHGVFLPAGEAWRAALAADPRIGVYGGDGFHPSVTGTYLAALVIYGRLSGRDVRALPSTALGRAGALPIPAAAVRLLRESAQAANATYPAEPGPPAGGVVPPGRVIEGLNHC
jgi:hypothetical protein